MGEQHERSTVEAVEGILKKVQAAKILLGDCPKDEKEGIRTAAVRYCLQRTINLAEGVSMIADGNNFDSVISLVRSMYETLLRVAWVVQSDENAEEFRHIGFNLMLKYVKGIVEKGHGKITPAEVDPENTEDARQALEVSDSIISHIKNAKVPAAPHWNRMATETGLEMLHGQLYGYLSIGAHGSTFGFEQDETTEDGMEGSMPFGNTFSLVTFADGLVAATCAVSRDWALYRKVAGAKEIMQILG